MNSELIAKAKEAKSAEELLSLAKENAIELTGEQAKEYYDRLHTTGELADDELDSVSGGGCRSVPSGARVINDPLHESCDHYLHDSEWIDERCCQCCQYHKIASVSVHLVATYYCAFGL